MKLQSPPHPCLDPSYYPCPDPFVSSSSLPPTIPSEVESALVEHPSCSEAAVVPFNHPIKGQAIYAFVTLMEGVFHVCSVSSSPTELKSVCSTSAPYPLFPQIWRVCVPHLLHILFSHRAVPSLPHILQLSVLQQECVTWLQMFLLRA